jgi:hypothetical protein
MGAVCPIHLFLRLFFPTVIVEVYVTSSILSRFLVTAARRVLNSWILNKQLREAEKE